MKRFNLVLGAETIRALEELQTQTGRASKADVVRDALALYDYLVQKARIEKKTIFLGNTKDDAAELMVTSIEEAKKLKEREASHS